MITIYLDINELDEGIERISLVDYPAIEKNFISLSKQFKFIKDEYRKLITGPILIPDKPIYRNDESGEYYISFSKDAIERIATKLINDGTASKVDTMHNQVEIDKIYPIEIYIKDENKDIKGFEDLPIGTLFVTYKITDKELFDKIDNSFKGFSIEGTFSEDRTELEQLFNKIKNIK